ncbi:MAG TPA: hypothetical protein VGG27_10825 [Magnetospirillaceae bacterium]|jgi:hypothetical protein
MSIAQKVIRWVLGIVAGGVVYTAVQYILPKLESGVSAISPMVLVLNTALLATAAGFIVGAFITPRAQLPQARRYFFALGMLTPIGRAVWDYAHTGSMHHNYLLMIAGAFSGGMLGAFVMLMPKPQRQAQPRRFG